MDQEQGGRQQPWLASLARLPGSRRGRRGSERGLPWHCGHGQRRLISWCSPRPRLLISAPLWLANLTWSGLWLGLAFCFPPPSPQADSSSGADNIGTQAQVQAQAQVRAQAAWARLLRWLAR